MQHHISLKSECLRTESMRQALPNFAMYRWVRLRDDTIPVLRPEIVESSFAKGGFSSDDMSMYVLVALRCYKVAIIQSDAVG